RPRLLSRENEDRREPDRQRAEDLFDRLERAAPFEAGRRLAIERVLSDVEVERRQVRVHEGRKRGDDAGKVEIGVSLTHPAVELGKLVQHQPIEVAYRRKIDLVALLVKSERPQHPAEGVAQLAVIVAYDFQDFGADALVVGIVDARDP